MQILGNVCLGLAALIYAAMPALLNDAAKRQDGGVVWTALFGLAPLWLCLAAGLEAAVWRGGLDWLGYSRGWLFSIVLACCLSLAVISFFSFILRGEPASQVPWAVRPFEVWSVWVFPLVTFGFGLFTLNPSWGAAVPRMAYAAPMAAVSALGLLGTVGLLVQLAVWSQAEQARRVEEAVEVQRQRDDAKLQKLQSLDPAKDFPELLGLTNRFHDREIRELAIEKIRSRPDHVEALADALTNGWSENGLIYLDGYDIPAEERAALAQPVLEAMRVQAGVARRSIENAFEVYPEQFDFATRLMLSVAEKFRDQGVDYAAAIREYRQALDEGKAQGAKLNARRTLDSWLAKQR